jgi:hypothetical protein
MVWSLLILLTHEDRKQILDIYGKYGEEDQNHEAYLVPLKNGSSPLRLLFNHKRETGATNIAFPYGVPCERTSTLYSLHLLFHSFI